MAIISVFELHFIPSTPSFSTNQTNKKRKKSKREKRGEGELPFIKYSKKYLKKIHNFIKPFLSNKGLIFPFIWKSLLNAVSQSVTLFERNRKKKKKCLPLETHCCHSLWDKSFHSFISFPAAKWIIVCFQFRPSTSEMGTLVALLFLFLFSPSFDILHHEILIV